MPELQPYATIFFEDEPDAAPVAAVPSVSAAPERIIAMLAAGLSDIAFELEADIDWPVASLSADVIAFLQSLDRIGQTLRAYAALLDRLESAGSLIVNGSTELDGVFAALNRFAPGAAHAAAGGTLAGTEALP